MTPSPQDTVLIKGRLEGAISILEAGGEFDRDGLLEILREACSALSQPPVERVDRKAVVLLAARCLCAHDYRDWSGKTWDTLTDVGRGQLIRQAREICEQALPPATQWADIEEGER